MVTVDTFIEKLMINLCFIEPIIVELGHVRFRKIIFVSLIENVIFFSIIDDQYRGPVPQ